jgi:hypothetical protein
VGFGPWEGVTRKVAPSLSDVGKAAYHARWVNEFQKICDEWEGRDQRQVQFYNALKNKHRKQLEALKA